MIITQTPTRLSLFGGNTDFREYFLKYGGAVLTATIDKYVYCVVKERFDDLIIVNYSEKEIVPRVNNLKHDIVREALKLLGITKGIEISFLADIPGRGTGLGSSSSVAVGVLNALHAYLGESVDANRLAEEAVQIEVDILKKPIGIQDQYAVAVGGLSVFEFAAESGKVTRKVVGMPDSIKEDFNNSLTLFYTGVTRRTEDVLAGLDISANKEKLDQKKLLVTEGVSALIRGDLTRFGKMMGQSWSAKKDANAKTTSSEIDLMYDEIMKAGALGGKVIGAGGGGFMLAMFPANRRASVRNALKEYKEMPFRFVDFGSRVIFHI